MSSNKNINCQRGSLSKKVLLLLCGLKESTNQPGAIELGLENETSKKCLLLDILDIKIDETSRDTTDITVEEKQLTDI